MNKIERLAFITALCTANHKAIVIEALPAEVHEEIGLTAAARDDHSILDGFDAELIDLPNRALVSGFESIDGIEAARQSSAHEDRYILTPGERAQLARDKEAYHQAQDLAVFEMPDHRNGWLVLMPEARLTA